MNKKFSAKLRKSHAKGYPFRSSFMARGDGTHMLPVKSDIRKMIGKEAGDRVTVLVKERLSR